MNAFCPCKSVLQAVLHQGLDQKRRHQTRPRILRKVKIVCEPLAKPKLHDLHVLPDMLHILLHGYKRKGVVHGVAQQRRQLHQNAAGLLVVVHKDGEADALDGVVDEMRVEAGFELRLLQVAPSAFQLQVLRVQLFDIRQHQIDPACNIAKLIIRVHGYLVIRVGLHHGKLSVQVLQRTAVIVRQPPGKLPRLGKQDRGQQYQYRQPHYVIIHPILHGAQSVYIALQLRRIGPLHRVLHTRRRKAAAVIREKVPAVQQRLAGAHGRQVAVVGQHHLIAGAPKAVYQRRLIHQEDHLPQLVPIFVGQDTVQQPFRRSRLLEAIYLAGGSLGGRQTQQLVIVHQEAAVIVFLAAVIERSAVPVQQQHIQLRRRVIAGRAEKPRHLTLADVPRHKLPHGAQRLLIGEIAAAVGINIADLLLRQLTPAVQIQASIAENVRRQQR